MAGRLILFMLLLPLFLYANTVKTLICQPDGTFSQSELYEALGLKQPSWYEFWKDKYPKINAKLTTSFYESLQNFYQSQGFYHAKIDKEESNTTITFYIKKGVASSVADIQSDLEARYNQLITFQPGDRFIATRFIEIKQTIKKKL